MKAIDLNNPECKAHIDALNAKSLAHLRAKIATKRKVLTVQPYPYAPLQVLDNGPVIRNYEKLSTGVWIAYDANGKAWRIRKEVHKGKPRWYGGCLTADTLKGLAGLIEKQGLVFSFLPAVLKV